MKLSDLKKTAPISLGANPDGTTAQVWVRHGGADVTLKQNEEECRLRKNLGLPEGADLPLWALIEARLRARVGTRLASWSGIDDDSGTPIPVRLPDGSLNEDGGYSILRIHEVMIQIDAEADRQQAAFDSAKEQATKNLPGPSPVN